MTVAVHMSENFVHQDGGSPYCELPHVEPATTGAGCKARVNAIVMAVARLRIKATYRPRGRSKSQPVKDTGLDETRRLI
jgi:hypothetical protein